MKPSDFEALPEREKALYMALNRATNTMREYERHLVEKQNRPKGRGNKNA